MNSETPAPPAPSGPASSGRDAGGDGQARQLLEQCWDVICGIVLARAEEIVNEVVAAATRAGDEAQLRCARTLSLQSRNAAAGFRSALRGHFDAAVAAFLGKGGDPEFPPSRLTLVAFDQADLSSEIDQGAARLRSLVEAPLIEVSMRLQKLSGAQEATDADLPLRPGLFIEAAADCLSSLFPVAGEVAALLRHFPVALQPRLTGAYADINRLLESRGIAAAAPVRAAPVLRSSYPATIRIEIPASVRQLSIEGDADAPAAPASGARAQASARSVGGRGPAGAGARHEADPGAEPDEAGVVEYGRRQGLFGINATALVDAAVAAARGEPPAAAQRPATALLRAMLAGQKEDAERIAAMERAGESDAPAAPAWIGTREYSKRLIGLAGQPLHKLTTQFIARLFARMERDSLVPVPVRDLLLCLRFPALEVALADASFLVRRDHPARRLINAIGSSAAGWTSEAPNGRRYLQQVRAAVQFVLHSPGGAASAFVHAEAQFADFLAASSPIAEDVLGKAQDALREAEERELRAGAVGAFLHEVLEGARIDETLRSFLFSVWPRVVVEAAAGEGADPGLVRRLMGVVPDLVWSVQPLSGAADRRRLIETIPSVLTCVREGLHLIGWPDEKLKSFLDHLMRAHAHSLRTADRPAEGNAEAHAAGAGVFSASTVRIRLDGLRVGSLPHPAADRPIEVVEEAVRQVLRARGCGVTHESIESEGAVPARDADAEQARREIARWREKTWFDLRVGEATVRVRLEWFTPARALALFCSARGDALYCLSRVGLAGYQRRSWITPAEPMPLLARAFRTMLSDLDRSSRAAAGDSDASGADGR